MPGRPISPSDFKDMDSRDKSANTNLDIPDTTTSFVFGRSILIKGKIDTIQEFSSGLRTKEVKKTLLTMLGHTGSECISPKRSANSFSMQQNNSIQIQSRDDSSISSGVNDLNDSCDLGNVDSADKQQELTVKMTQIPTYGVLNNPFTFESVSLKDTCSSNMKNGGSECLKLSMPRLPSQAGLSTKSEGVL